MSAACRCGRCYGCDMARAAGDYYDTTDEEARELAEELAAQQEVDAELACHVDDDGAPFA